MRRFVKNDGPFFVQKRIEHFFFSAVLRQKSFEGKAARRKARRRKRCYNRARAGDRNDRKTAFARVAAKLGAGVGYAGRARVGHERTAFAGGKLGKDRFARRAFVVLEIVDDRLFDAEMIEQKPRNARVLRRDKIDLAQGL